MTILQQIEEHIFQIHKDKLSHQYTYHNFNHTLSVVNGLEEIIKHSSIDDHSKDLLRYAAWFHDIGYVNAQENHEETSALMAQEFLREHKIIREDINVVMQLIRATQLEHTPKNELECIIKDADFVHFTDENYSDICLLLKAEVEASCGNPISELDWQLQNKEFMLYKHRYYSAYAQQYWQPKKQKNLLNVISKIEKSKKKSKGKTKEESTRSIETLFRTTLRNHTQLSAIADSKANILLSVNAIIISICLSTLIPKLDSSSNSHLIIPTFVLLIFSVATIIFAIQSTRPKVTSGKFTKEEVNNKEVNLLFFGTFHQMPFNEYEDSVLGIIDDKKYIYHALTKDLYNLGIVLNKKYKLLRITYTIFTVGIVLSVIAFTLAFKGVGF